MEDHELVTRCKDIGTPLAPALAEMLNEHHDHQSERRGSGFTQATRYLAALINRSPQRRTADAVRTALFATPQRRNGRDALLRLPDELEREESRLLAGLLAQLVEPPSATVATPALRGHPGTLPVGSCTMAEKYFLELAHYRISRDGRVNIWLDDTGAPLLIEKMHMGDNHSCVSLQPLSLNGVRLPPGCLLAVAYRDDLCCPRRGGRLPGHQLAVADSDGFRLLRLTTLAVSPANRARAFGRHFRAQLDAGWFAPGPTCIDDLRQLADAETAAHRTVLDLIPALSRGDGSAVGAPRRRAAVGFA